MNNGVLRNDLHFSVIPQHDPKFMLLFDHSEYIGNPKQMVYDITKPGFSAHTRINGRARGITSISALLLTGSFGVRAAVTPDLPDGIYTITQRIQPHDEIYCTTHHLRLSVSDSKLDDIYSALEFDVEHRATPKWKTDLTDIELLLRTAKALCNKGNIKLASEILQTGLAKLDKLYRNIKSIQ